VLVGKDGDENNHLFLSLSLCHWQKRSHTMKRKGEREEKKDEDK